ncbi:uncharacterized protein LOC109597483 [Aethina tumida]|uniref:uncharacterized protein LOC109597483 n=1 Tax=Aethina tumida TaxID=116153 RepID=UPI00096AE1D6|nr:uncharacterized protein LOC109597483 [Aethina tumida]
MNGFVLVGAFVLLCQVQTGSSIKCYSCASEENKGCIKPNKSNITLVNCTQKTLEETRRFAANIRQEYDKVFEVDMHEMGLELNCLKMITKVDNKEYVIRGCQLAVQQHLDICHKVKTEDREFVSTLHCSRCGSDGCNSSTQLRYSATLIAFFIMTKKLLL